MGHVEEKYTRAHLDLLGSCEQEWCVRAHPSPPSNNHTESDAYIEQVISLCLGWHMADLQAFNTRLPHSKCHCHGLSDKRAGC